LDEGWARASAQPIRSIETRSIGGAATPRQKGVPVLRLAAFMQVFAAESLGELRREEGQTMAEYGVVLAVIVLACIAAITLLSSHVRDAITSVANLLPG
jgi:Flp pilus assembly pilin Flp